MKIYIIMTDYWGERIPLGITANHSEIEGCDYIEYDTEDLKDNYYDFPPWSM